MGPKPPKPQGPGEQEQAAIDQLGGMWGGPEGGYQAAPGTLQSLQGLQGLAQNTPFGPGMMKQGRQFVRQQLGGMPTRQQYQKPIMQQINRDYGQQYGGMVNSMAGRNLLGSGNLQSAGAKLAESHQFAKGQGRLQAEDMRQRDIAGRQRSAFGALGAMGQAYGQQLGGQQAALQGGLGYGQQQMQMQQAPFQQGLQYLSSMSGGRQQDYQQQMAYNQAMNQYYSNMWGPVGGIGSALIMKPGGI